jgi:hypothetical protein
MWLIILGLAAAVVTPLWYSRAEKDEYLLRYLCLILWGGFLMGLVDRLAGFFAEGGPFLDLSLEAAVLGLSMLVIALAVWETALLLKDPKRVLLRKQKSS